MINLRTFYIKPADHGIWQEWVALCKKRTQAWGQRMIELVKKDVRESKGGKT